MSLTKSRGLVPFIQNLFVLFIFLFISVFALEAKACYLPYSICGGAQYFAGIDRNGCDYGDERYAGWLKCYNGIGQIYYYNCVYALMICPSSDPGNPTQNSNRNRCEASNSGHSTILSDSQVVLEQVPIVGTDFSLVYSSARVPGNTTWYEVDIPLTGSTIESSLSQVDLTVSVGGSSTNYSDTSPHTGDSYHFHWNGQDANGAVSGSVPYTSSASTTYNPPHDGYELGDNFGGINSPLFLGYKYIDWVGLGGWDINIHHSYDSTRKVLYLGDGTSLDTDYTTLSNGNFRVVSSDASEVYIFDSTWKHISTLNGLLGSTKYTFSYNASNQLAYVTDAYSNTTSFVYADAGGNLNKIIAPFGQATLIILSTDRYISSIKNPNNEVYTMTYYSGGLLHTFQKPSGVTSTMTYSSSGRLLTDSSSAGNSDTLSRTINFSPGWMVGESSAEGRATSHAVTDNPLTYYHRIDTDPAGYVSDYYYTSGISQSQVADNLNSSYSSTGSDDVRFGSNAKFLTSQSWTEGNQTKSLSASQSATLETSGDPFSVTTYAENYTINNKATSIAYSSSDSKFTYTSAEGRHFYRIIDSNERTTSIQLAGLTPITYSYDTHGRLFQIHQGILRATTFGYDSTTGYLSSISRALTGSTNLVTGFSYDDAGRVIAETLPDSREIGFTYDSNGNLSSVTPPGKSAHTLNHNGFDLLSSYVTPNGRSLKEANEASPGFQAQTLILIGGDKTDYTYNNDKQLTLITRPDQSTIQFTYGSSDGVLGSIVTPSGTNFYTFNHGKTPSYFVSYDGVAEEFGFNGKNLTSSTTHFDTQNSTAGSVNYTYNNDFLISDDTVTSNGTTSGTRIDYAYDGDNLLTGAGDETITRDSNTGFVSQETMGSNVQENYAYTATFGELSQIQDKYGSTVNYQEDMARDKLGRISSRTENYSGTSHTYDYTYDASGRLTRVKKDSLNYESYSYDSNSNRISQTISGVTTTGSYDGKDRLGKFGKKSYTFSSNGELQKVSDSQTNPNSITSFAYDALGNLKSVTLPDRTVITYTVDASNRRVSKVIGSNIQNYYVWGSHNELLAMLDSSGLVTKRFIYGTRSNVPDYAIISGMTYKIVSNHLGSPVMVINTSNGNIAQQITYDDFGNILSDTSPGFQPFGFAGCLYDNNTKLCRFGARDYDAEVGRWTNRDPILFAGGDTNLYGYVLMDAVNQIDPTGLGIGDGIGGQKEDDAANLGAYFFNHFVCPHIQGCTPLPYPPSNPIAPLFFPPHPSPSPPTPAPKSSPEESRQCR